MGRFASTGLSFDVCYLISPQDERLEASFSGLTQNMGILIDADLARHVGEASDGSVSVCTPSFVRSTVPKLTDQSQGTPSFLSSRLHRALLFRQSAIESLPLRDPVIDLESSIWVLIWGLLTLGRAHQTISRCQQGWLSKLNCFHDILSIKIAKGAILFAVLADNDLFPQCPSVSRLVRAVLQLTLKWANQCSRKPPIVREDDMDIETVYRRYFIACLDCLESGDEMLDTAWEDVEPVRSFWE